MPCDRCGNRSISWKFFYKDEGKQFHEIISDVVDLYEPWGFEYYNTKDKKALKDGDFGIHFIEQIKEEKWSSSAPDVVTITRIGTNSYRLTNKKPGTAEIKVTFSTNAGYRYTVRKTVHFLTQKKYEVYNEMLNNAEEYFDQWKAKYRIQYTEEEVAQKLAEIVKKFPEGEYYKDSKYYKTEWEKRREFDEFDWDYTPEGFSYVFAAKINCMVFGKKQCLLYETDMGEFVYSTVERGDHLLFGCDSSDGVRREYAVGYANGCSGFSKKMDHFTNDFDRIRVGDIVIIHKELGTRKARAGVVLSKSGDAIHVIYSDKTTHYVDWTRESLEEDDFLVITRYE